MQGRVVLLFCAEVDDEEDPDFDDAVEGSVGVEVTMPFNMGSKAGASFSARFTIALFETG